MSASEDLKQIAMLRKAILPLATVLKDEVTAEANVEATKEVAERLHKMDEAITELLSQRLNQMDSAIVELLKRELNVTVNAPEVHNTVEMPTNLISALEKIQAMTLQKSAPTVIKAETPTVYEPHDQSGGLVKYNGFVASNGSWKIQRISKNEQRYAFGKGDYAKSWETRDKLKYGYADGS